MPIAGKNRLAGDALFAALENASRGLNYVSETDAEIIPVLADRSSTNEYVQEQGQSQPIETGSAAEFFERLTKDRVWHSDAEKRNVRRFRKLEKLLSSNVEGLAMFRAGRVRVEIFVLGYDADGNIAGIRTRSVET